MQLIIRNDGCVRAIYDETLDLSMLGEVSIARGSHVEPDEQGQWFADLSPVMRGQDSVPFQPVALPRCLPSRLG